MKQSFYKGVVKELHAQVLSVVCTSDELEGCYDLKIEVLVIVNDPDFLQAIWDNCFVCDNSLEKSIMN